MINPTDLLRPMPFKDFVTMIVYSDEPADWKIKTIQSRIEAQKGHLQ